MSPELRLLSRSLPMVLAIAALSPNVLAQPSAPATFPPAAKAPKNDRPEVETAEPDGPQAADETPPAGADPASLFPRRSSPGSDTLFPTRRHPRPRGELCPRSISLVDPLASPLRDTGLDTSRGGCSVDAWASSFRLLVVSDDSEYFGTLAGAWFLSRRLVNRAGIELELGARVVDYLRDAVEPKDELSVGPVWLSASRSAPVDWWPGAVIAHRFRVELPYTDRRYRPLTVAVAPGVDLTAPLRGWLFLHVHTTALLWTAIRGSEVDNRAALQVAGDGVLRLSSWLAAGLGVEAQAGWYDSGIDHVAPRGGLRFAIGSARIEFAAAVPLVGEELVDLTSQLGFSL